MLKSCFFSTQEVGFGCAKELETVEPTEAASSGVGFSVVDVFDSDSLLDLLGVIYETGVNIAGSEEMDAAAALDELSFEEVEDDYRDSPLAVDSFSTLDFKALFSAAITTNITAKATQTPGSFISFV